MIRPQWKCLKTKALFARAEIAMRAKLKIDGSLFSDVEFNYKSLQVGLRVGIRTMFGALEVVGFDGAAADFYYAICEDDSLDSLDLQVDDPHPAESVMFYTHELVEMKSKIAGDPDRTIYYSIFSSPKSSAADAAASASASVAVDPMGRDSSKNTLVYIPGGPWSAFSTNDFLNQYKPFIAEGYTIIVPHEPLRDGFGYNYLLAKNQLGRRNLHHIMNALDDACTKGVNPKMVLMGESYGGWVASALAVKWRDFAPERSPVELKACIAQSANLNLDGWKDENRKIGELIFAATFADDPVDVASITKLQAPLLIYHGLGDVRCPIESIQVWTNGLKATEQKFAFITVPEGHKGIVAPSDSPVCSPQERKLRLNIAKRLFEGNGIPAASTEKLGKYGIEILHDSLSLFELSVAGGAAAASSVAAAQTMYSSK